MRLGLAAALLVGISAPSQATAYYQNAGDWVILKSDDACSMWLDYEGPGSTKLGLAKLDDGLFFISISNSNWSVKRDAHYKVDLVLDGMTYGGADAIGSDGGIVMRLPADFEGHFASGQGLKVYLDERKIDDLSLSGSAAAMKSTNRCLAEVRREEAAQRAYEARFADIPKDPFATTKPLPEKGPRDPIPKDGATMVAANYPSSAIRNKEEGVVGYAVTVGPDGVASDCKIISSSGHPDLDQAACSSVMRYMHFEPAIDKDGKIVEGQYTNKVTYRLN